VEGADSSLTQWTTFPEHTKNFDPSQKNFMINDLLDECRLLVHPVIVGEGLPLMKNVFERMKLSLVQIKQFSSGTGALYYVPAG
jgi:hypothetical protein